MSNKIVLIIDIEVYRDYFLVAFLNVTSGKKTLMEMRPGTTLDIEKLRAILRAYTLVGFNVLNYDVPILMLALSGADNAKLKAASDAIIVTGLRPWQLESKFGVNMQGRGLDIIDLIEVAPGKASLKLYGGKLHSATLQDLPFDPAESIGDEKAAQLREYCINDLKLTSDLYHKFLPQLELRKTMSKEYGVDLRSKSDAQVAETVISHEIHKASGIKLERPDIATGTSYRYKAPKFLSFNTDVMREVYRKLTEAEYVVNDSGKIIMPNGLDKETFTLGASEYRIGLGGLHSCEESAMHVADDEWMLIDRDVASYYPAIILNCNLYPQHLGTTFLAVYRRVIEERLRAKETSGKLRAQITRVTRRIEELEREEISIP